MTKENEHDSKQEYLTQQEVANLFRVTTNTVRNWRKAGFLDYFQVPCSTRVLYPVESVDQFREEHRKKATVIPFKKKKEVIILEGHELSSNRIKKEWRI